MTQTETFGRRRPPRFVVRCADYTSGPLISREQAERRLQSIEQLGGCRLQHEIVEFVKQQR